MNTRRLASLLVTVPFVALPFAACGDGDGPNARQVAGGGSVNIAGMTATAGQNAMTAGSGGSAGVSGSVGASGSAGAAGMPSGILIPAQIEAEAFVRGFEADTEFQGVEECKSSVEANFDILKETATGACFLGYLEPSEWVEYDIYVAQSGAFDLTFRAATGQGGKSIAVSIDGEARGAALLTQTDWETFAEVSLTRLNLTAGAHKLRLEFPSGGVNLDWLAFTAAGPCTASCGERICGTDECGNSCGSCAGGLLCTGIGKCFDPSLRPIPRFGQLSVKDGKIVDSKGNPAQLRGVSTQWLNWEKTYSTSKAGLEWMRDNWGLRVLRVANGVEGNGGYLTDPVARTALVKQIIDNAIAAEVYVIVDWHTHQPQHKDVAKAFFADIAQTYGDKPNIIYEIFNEPLALDWDTELKPYHEDVVAEIRKYDPDNLIVLGTPRWDQRPDQAAANPVVGTNLAYALHFYACSHGPAERSYGQTALKAGLALFVTEWGGTHADGGTATNPAVCDAQTRQWFSWINTNQLSWAAWKLSSDGDSSAFLVPGAPLEGGWTDMWIKGHGPLVREFMLAD